MAITTSLPLLAQQSTCTINPHDSSCALQSTLHLLHWLALILAFVLLVIVVVAITAYRKIKKAKLTPDG
jgi:hypothetical protein